VPFAFVGEVTEGSGVKLNAGGKWEHHTLVGGRSQGPVLRTLQAEGAHTETECAGPREDGRSAAPGGGTAVVFRPSGKTAAE